MARIAYSATALCNLEGIADFLATDSEQAALHALDLIDDAISMLARHPLVGRPAENHLRELVISQGRTGYIALYAYDSAQDVILVLAVRHQREAGFRYNPAP
ncbi:type II toxin-antitoxin system RelE/ParE family toxin [Pseudoduganella sp. OTU4001]|uniref:type II toxin-antitoxin system RelE/ParE family toxin n=1 Tax=Pseudoduganella sp. OTU4001 TaxID=3043854 RepID=UPI00313D1195